MARPRRMGLRMSLIRRSSDRTLVVSVSLPNTTAPAGSSCRSPVTVGSVAGQAVRSYDLQVSFNSAVLQPMPTAFSTFGTISIGMAVAANTSNAGHVIISAFQASDASGSGTLINLNFMVVGSVGQSTALAFADYTDPNTILHPGFRFNAGTPTATTSDGSLMVTGGTPTNTPTNTPTSTPTFTPTNTPTATATATNTPTSTPTSTPTNTPTATATSHSDTYAD